MEELALDISTPLGIATITVIAISLIKHLILKRALGENTYFREIVLGLTALSCGILCIISHYIGSDGVELSWFATTELFLASYAASIAGFETIGKRIEQLLTEWLTPKDAVEDGKEKQSE